MSVTLDILRSLPTDDVATPFVVEEPVSEVPCTRWDPETFAREQIRSLVRQVFLHGGPTPPRQVVFCGVDAGTDVAEVCALVGKDLAAQISGRVCLVEANPRSPTLQLSMSGRDLEERHPRMNSSERGLQCISDNLWLMCEKEFRGNDQQSRSNVHLRLALTEIRRDFEYAIIHAAPASLCSEPALLGHLTDGVVLVLEAHFTRRVAARKVIQDLHRMNARLLGTVLNQRTFPIPERLYRRL